MSGRQALGRGLRSLIPQIEEADSYHVENVKVSDIETNPFQPRKHFDEEKMKQLADSIEQYGVLEPIIVRQAEGKYQVVVGERRWRACKLAGLSEIPAVIKSLSDRQMMEVALIENLQREDLNAIEEAEGYNRLMKEFSLTQEQVAFSVGKRRSSVANALRLLSLEEEIKVKVANGMLSRGHAKVLLGIEDAEYRSALAEKCVSEDLSVRQLEKLLHANENVPRRTKRGDNPNVLTLQEELQRVLGTRVRLDYRSGKGKIQIEYYSDDELERILEFIRG